MGEEPEEHEGRDFLGGMLLVVTGGESPQIDGRCRSDPAFNRPKEII
jgi:hypothetical protein